LPRPGCLAQDVFPLLACFLRADSLEHPQKKGCHVAVSLGFFRCLVIFVVFLRKKGCLASEAF